MTTEVNVFTGINKFRYIVYVETKMYFISYNAAIVDQLA